MNHEQELKKLEQRIAEIREDMKMNQKYKQAWIDALRSGEYEQGEGYLCKDGKYCCLGVLEQINAEELGTEIRSTKDGDHVIGKFDGFIGTPRDKHMQVYFLSDEQPQVEIDGRVLFLSEHNDNGVSFAKIADAIEAQL